MIESMTERALRVSRTVEVEAFSVEECDGQRMLYFRTDPDLFITCQAAADGGSHAAVVLVELGLDGSNAHRVKLGRGTVHLEDDERGNPAFYDCQGKDNLAVLRDTIEALTGLYEELAGMRGAERIA